MKEKDGVFDRSYCYFGLNRQNSEFQQKGLVCRFKKGVNGKTPTHVRWCFSAIFKIGLRNI